MKEMFGYICCVIGMIVGATGLYYALGWGWLVAATVIFVYGVLVIRAARRGGDSDLMFNDPTEMGFDFDD